jgi:hypothetical protein
LPDSAEALRLDARLINTDKNLTGEFAGTIRFAIIKGNHVSGSFVSYMCLIEVGYLSLVDEVNSKLKAFLVQEFAEQFVNNAPEEGHVDPARGLTVS